MLEVKELSFAYGKKNILQNVSFSARPGQLTVLLGPNGAGKTTLLNCLAGLAPARGEILFQGQPAAKACSPKVGFLEQNTSCQAALTVTEVVLLGRLERLGFQVEARELAGVARVLEILGLSELAGRRITELSGGQRQLVFIAQILVKCPRLLILDEPTSALDLEHQFRLLTLLQRLTKEEGYTTILTLHHLDLAEEYGDWLLVLKDGSVYREGTAEQVFTREMLREVYQVEAEIFTDSRGRRHVIPVGICGEREKERL